MDEELFAQQLRARADHATPTFSLDPTQLVRQGRRRRTARITAVSLGAALLVAAPLTLFALRPAANVTPATTPAPVFSATPTTDKTTDKTAAQPATPNPSATIDRTVVQLAAGDRFRVTDTGWTLTNEWIIDFAPTTVEQPDGSVLVSLGVLYDVDGLVASDCASAVSCAEANGLPVTTETAGDVTYYKTSFQESVDDPFYYVMRYVDWKGQVYHLTDVNTGDPRLRTALLESIDWTGTRGTMVYLPTGVRIGVDMPPGWEARDVLFFTPTNDTTAESVQVSRMTTCSSAATCAQGEDFTTTPNGTQTINGVTYYLTTWSIEGFDDWERKSWDCEWNGHVYQFWGDPSQLDTFMKSVEWIQ